MKTIDDDQKNLNELNNTLSMSNQPLAINALAHLSHETNARHGSTLADLVTSSTITHDNKRKFEPEQSTASAKKSTSTTAISHVTAHDTVEDNVMSRANAWQLKPQDSTNAVIQKFVNDNAAAYDFFSTEDFESFVTTIDWTEQTPIACAPMHTYLPLINTASIDTNILDNDALAILLGLDSEETELGFNTLETIAEINEWGNAFAQHNGNNLNHAIIDADLNTHQNKGSDDFHEDANKIITKNKYRLKIYTGYFYLKASTSDLSSMHKDYADIKEDVLNACKAMYEKSIKIKKIARVTYQLDELWQGSDSITRLRFCLLQAASHPYEFMYIVDRILSTQYTKYVTEVLDQKMNLDDKNSATFFEYFMKIVRNSEDAEDFSQAIKRILTSRSGHFTNKLIENSENSHLYHFINLQAKNQVSLVKAFAMLHNKEAIKNSKRYENYLILLKQKFHYTDDHPTTSEQAASSSTMDFTSSISAAPVIALEQQLASQAPLYPTNISVLRPIDRANPYGFLNT